MLIEFLSALIIIAFATGVILRWKWEAYKYKRWLLETTMAIFSMTMAMWQLTDALEKTTESMREMEDAFNELGKRKDSDEMPQV